MGCTGAQPPLEAREQHARPHPAPQLSSSTTFAITSASCPLGLLPVTKHGICHKEHRSSVEEVRGLEVHCPRKLRSDRAWEDLLNGQVNLFAPSHRDSGVHVIDLGGAKGHGLVVLLHGHCSYMLVQPHLRLCNLLLAGNDILGQLALRVLGGLAGLDRQQVLLQDPDVLLHEAPDIFHFLHALAVRLGLCPLMVTQDGHRSVCVVVELDKLFLGVVMLGGHRKLSQLLLQCE
mmetsp:Transcript_121369/g.354771  ORF Transcript_121369/g.354771 Transcript_121369/m.354771 type:complete len:233 (+) Transcript_121369:73-771(+)